MATNGLRLTQARRSVAAVLDNAQRPLSHAEIESSLQGAIDRVTLYRVLESLLKVGLLYRIVDEHRVSRFMPCHVVDHHRHAHFHCGGCEHIYCMDARPPTRFTVPQGFQLGDVELRLRGRCGHCTATKRGRAIAGSRGRTSK